MEYRVRRTRPWGRDRLYRGASNEPFDWTPGGNPAARVLDSLRHLAPIYTRWTHYTRQELEAWVENPPGWSPGWLSVDELLEAVASDPDYEVQQRTGANQDWALQGQGEVRGLQHPQRKPGRRRRADDPVAQEAWRRIQELEAHEPPLTNKEIVRRLGISLDTLRRYRATFRQQ